MPQLVDLVVAARILLDVGVGPGQVGLGLVVVEVADEVLDGVVREELAEFRVQLGRKRLVVGQHQRRPLNLFDDRRHRERVVDDETAESGEERLRAFHGEVVDESPGRVDGLDARHVGPAAHEQATKGCHGPTEGVIV